ncbi:MAG: murein hydrolase activator EnvC family protein [bacterium]
MLSLRKQQHIARIIALGLIMLVAHSLTTTAAEEKSAISIKKEINELSSSIESGKEKSQAMQKEIRALDKKLNKISQDQHSTEKKIKDTEKQLNDSTQQQAQLRKDLVKEQDALAQQLQALYQAGEQSHLRLLFRQDEPSDISRTMKYMEYMNNARLNKIKKVQTTLKRLAELDEEIKKSRVDLTSLASNLRQQKDETSVLLKQRSASRKKLQRSIANKEKELDALLAQEARLQNVVAKIPEATTSTQPSTQADQTDTKNSKKTAALAETVATHDVPNHAFSKLKGKLSWPVQGKLVHRYNSQRNAKLRWKGVFLKAKGGRKVKAVAKGQVVFSDWMDGYGYLLIIQHDGDYLSLYAHNRALYKKEGERVNANEAIAAVGNTGNIESNGVYFEIRKGETPLNPEKWIK